MGRLFLLMTFLFGSAYAQAPECPIFKNKRQCLASVEENYKNFLDFINETYDEGNGKEDLLHVSLDIKKYEVLSCQRTCFD